MTAEWALAFAAIAIAVIAYLALGLLRAIKHELNLLRAEVHDALHPSDSVGSPDSHGARMLGEIHELSFNLETIVTEIQKLTADHDAAEYHRRTTPP